MPVDMKEVLSLISNVAEEEGLKVCISSSLKGGAIAGSTTIIGGLLAGPIGLAIGGALGGLAAYGCSEDFVSVPRAIAKMTPHQQRSLSNRMQKVLHNIDYTDGVMLTSMLLRADVKSVIVRELISYFRNEMSMAITC